MDQLYLWLNLGALSIPFLFSFHPKIQFYKHWPTVFPGILVMMLIFIPWDIYFTVQGFWGFNPDYLIGYNVAGLPVEEWLFFICIPYACLFTHYTIVQLKPQWSFSAKNAQRLFLILAALLIISLWYGYHNWYTAVSFSFALVVLGLTNNYKTQLFQSFFVSYAIILIPFFIVNGILTGSGLPEAVVWYNDAENFGLRLGTIPVEDTVYNLGMLLTVVLVSDYLGSRQKSDTRDV
ncbi:MAG: lycopene cyclase domain-containing protein [Flavobacteriaceae bacterium]|nr:lycopene cyclase domain-containing protein [Flavobacteriaceae bacterium]MDG1963044.1 lycopene cyclase domain-containing protein [Flavobacteriaceae bacterium]